MIKVTVELISAITQRTSTLGTAYLCNDGHGSPTLGDYLVGICRKGDDAVPWPVNPTGPKPTRSGKVNAYPRVNQSVWRLLARALLAAWPEEAVRKPGKDSSTISAEVMKGLQELASRFKETSGETLVQDEPEISTCVEEALEWLSAAGEGVGDDD